MKVIPIYSLWSFKAGWMVPWLGFIGPPTLRTDRSSKAVFFLFIKPSSLFLLAQACFISVSGSQSCLSPTCWHSGLFFNFLIPLRKMLYSKPLGCWQVNVGRRDEGFVIIILKNFFKLYWSQVIFELYEWLPQRAGGIEACFYLCSTINSIQLSPLSPVTPQGNSFGVKCFYDSFPDTMPPWCCKPEEYPNQHFPVPPAAGLNYG